MTTAAPERVAKRPKKVVNAQPWPTYGYDLARTHVAPYRLRPPFRRLWSIRAGNIIEFPPVIAYARVFVQQERGRIFSIDARTGRILWRRSFQHCSASSPAVGRGVLYVALMQPYPCSKGDRAQRGMIVALRVAGGKLLWRFPAGVIESSPLLVKDVLYFGSWDRKLYALDVRTRKLRWTFTADDELNSSPSYSGGTIYIASDGGSVYAVDARTGKMRWQAQSFSHFGRGREYFYATPAVAYGRVYIGNTDGTMFAFGAGSGHVLWARSAGTYVYTAAAIWKKTVYVGSYDGYVSAFDAATGDLRWRYHAPSSIHGAPTVLDGLVYFSSCGVCGEHGSRYAERGPRSTFALDARTGRLVWTFPDGQYSPLVADSKRVYLVGHTRIYGLVPRKTERQVAKRKRR